MKKNAQNKDFSKHPYKGVLTEVAVEQGVSPQAVWNAVNVYKNPRILTLVSEKVKERENALKKAHEALAC